MLTVRIGKKKSYKCPLDEGLIQEVSLEDAEKTLDSKNTIKMLKAFNFDNKREPTEGLEFLTKRLKDGIYRMIPRDIEESQKGASLLWILRYLRTEEGRRTFLGKILGLTFGERPPQGNDAGDFIDSVLAPGVSLASVKPSLETFFQWQRLMEPNDLNRIGSFEELENVVNQAKESIEAEKEKKLAKNVPEGAEFFLGDFKYDEEGNVARDEDRSPLFKDVDGWVIAAIHNKGAACLFGKNTEWCTAAPGLDYFDRVYYGGRDDPLFFFEDPSGDRYQFSYGQKEFMDVDDRRVTGDEFNRLHNKLKDVLSAKGLEDRFSIVFEHEEFDVDAAAEELVKEVDDFIEPGFKDLIDIDIQVDSYDDEYDMVSATINTRFPIPRLGNENDDLSKYGAEEIVGALQSLDSDWPIGYMEDYGGFDEAEGVQANISEFNTGIGISGWRSFSVSNEEQMGEVREWFRDSINTIEYKYNEAAREIMNILQREELVEKTEFDSYVSADEEDETEKEDFEESFNNVLVEGDTDTGVIEFTLFFDAPSNLGSKAANYRIGKEEEKKIFKAANEMLSSQLQKQPSLPGMEPEMSTEEIIDIASSYADNVMGMMKIAPNRILVDWNMDTTKLNEAQMRYFTKFMRLVDSNSDFYKKALSKATQEEVSTNPKFQKLDLKESKKRINVIIGRK
jgi:hypothetical protein